MANVQNIWSKRLMVTRKQTLTLTDGNGLARQFSYPANVWVAPDEVVVMTDAEFATCDTVHWLLIEPE